MVKPVEAVKELLPGPSSLNTNFQLRDPPTCFYSNLQIGTLSAQMRAFYGGVHR